MSIKSTNEITVKVTCSHKEVEQIFIKRGFIPKSK